MKSNIKEKFAFVKRGFFKAVNKCATSLKKISLMDVSRAVLCAASVTACFGMIYGFREKNESDKYVITDNKAEEYFYACNYSKAVTQYKELMKNDKRTSYWNTKIAEVYSVSGDINNSRKYIELAKKDPKNNTNVLNYIIFTELMNKDYTESLKDGENALNKHPKDKMLIKTMFTVYMVNNLNYKALELIEKYPLNKKSAYEICEHARMIMLAGKWDEGLSELKDAWNVDKDEYKVYDTIAQIASYNKEKILSSVSALEAKNPNDVVYKMWMAKILSSDPNSASQAVSIIDSINIMDTGKFQAKCIKATALQNLNKIQQADEIMNSVIKKYPNDYRVLHSAGWYYLSKKDYDKALSYCKQSILKNKDYPDNYGFLMPEILKAQNKTTNSEPYFRTAMLKEPYNYNIMLGIANFYWDATQNSTKAFEYFNLAETIKPDDAEIKYREARILLSDKKQDKAILKLLESIKLDASVTKYHRALGTIYLLQGKNSQALEQIKLAYQDDEQDILTLNNAGCYYITVDGNLERGLYNIESAYKGINDSTDKYNKETIKSNYEKAKKLVSDYNNGKGNEKITVPDFGLFY